MLVGLHRERDVGVPKPFAHDLQREPVLDEQGPVGVAKIMKADVGTPAL